MDLVRPVWMVRGARIEAEWIRASDGLGAIGLRRVMGAPTVRVAVPKPIGSQGRWHSRWHSIPPRKTATNIPWRPIRSDSDPASGGR